MSRKFPLQRPLALLALAGLSTILSGCANNQALYQWGGYNSALYSSYKDPEQVAAQQTKLETHIAAMNSSNQKVAPGLYAELGSLYLQTGKTSEAISQYKKERELWPESRGLMDAMISTLEKRQANGSKG